MNCWTGAVKRSINYKVNRKVKVSIKWLMSYFWKNQRQLHYTESLQNMS